MTNKEEQINQYEYDIFEQLKNLFKLKNKELDEIIIKKIKEQDPDKYKSFYPEKWQLHYAKERVKINIKKYNKKPDKEIKGFGGWLFLIVIGVVLNPFLIIFYFKLSYDINLLYGINGLNPLSFIIFAIEILLSFYIIFLLFTKKRRFIKWYIYLLIFSVIISCFNLLIFILSEGKILLEPIGSIKSFIRNIIEGIILISYLLNSKRVKNTFIN